MSEYQQHKIQFTSLQEKLLSDKAQQEQLHKQKKKPRPTDQGIKRCIMRTTFSDNDICLAKNTRIIFFNILELIYI